MTMNVPASSSTAGGIVRLRIDLGYDGSEFYGWARQAGFRTVQAELERGLRFACKLTEEPSVVCAGRTDSGVHARGQVVHVDVPLHAWERLRDRNLFPLRSVLPNEIGIHKVDLAPENFHARFSALARRYVYRVCDDPALRDPIRRREIYFYPAALDLAAMNEAAQQLLGLHDFVAFCRSRPGATSIRSLEQLQWQRDSNGIAELTVVADAFCHSMVRSLVGSLLPVGIGEQPTDWPANHLVAPPSGGQPATMVDFGRKASGFDHRAEDQCRPVPRGPFTVAPAHGLTLEEVFYPPVAELAARNQTTRAMRA